MITHLDYPKAKLSMEATNQVEETYRVKACEKEPWTVQFIESIPAGAVFWDLGANVGPYTLIAAYRNLYTVAIEPGFNNYAALCRNLALNNLLDKALCLCQGVGAEAKLDWLHYHDLRAGGASHLLGGTRKQSFHKQLIRVSPLDALVKGLLFPPEQPHFVKIDTDGSELDVLKGAAASLDDPRFQGILTEMIEQRDEIIALMNAAGWQLQQEWNDRGQEFKGLEGTAIPHTGYGLFTRKEA